jgi:hypothetical protein
MLREAKRQNRAYQKVSIAVLGRYAAVRSDLDLSQDVLAISSSAVEDLVSTADDMDVDGPDAKIKDSLRDDILVSSVASSAQVFSPVVVSSKGTASTRTLCNSDLTRLSKDICTVHGSLMRRQLHPGQADRRGSF